MPREMPRDMLQEVAQEVAQEIPLVMLLGLVRAIHSKTTCQKYQALC